MGGEALLSRYRKRCYEIMDVANRTDLPSRLFDDVLVVLILLNLIAVVLESVEPLSVTYARFFAVFETFSIAVFTVEYLLRLWACSEDPTGRFKHPFLGRIRYLFTPLALIDLLAILPFYLSTVMTVDLRYIRVLRLLRVLKVVRYSLALATLVAAVHRERHAILSSIAFMVILLFFAAGTMFFIEGGSESRSFSNIPETLWWGVTTITTVGYGDVVPQTVPGRIFGALIMLMGIATFAFPTAIITSAFAQEIKKRDFIVTWNMVARVPFFSELSASQVSQIVALLTSRSVMPNEDVTHHKTLEGMYFIISGEVVMGRNRRQRKLGPGDHLCEKALLYEGLKTPTMVSPTYTELLELRRDSLRELMERNSDLNKAISVHMNEKES